ncbi:transcriptional regulator, AbrB family [Candidatus Scalindua japonica]|uniref:Transcriptional regulator, AbrB family n=1 Tax=Candidatus Scalindua japonica TaxID=1284222 RepID=A0A286U3T5_9BACT|nr:transcriptional regulator, AbrB family [Candidatus Scalindua japonica]
MVIPKEIRDKIGIKPKQKVLLKVVKNHVEIEPIPGNPIDYFCGIFKRRNFSYNSIVKTKNQGQKA